MCDWYWTPQPLKNTCNKLGNTITLQFVSIANLSLLRILCLACFWPWYCNSHCFYYFLLFATQTKHTKMWKFLVSHIPRIVYIWLSVYIYSAGNYLSYRAVWNLICLQNLSRFYFRRLLMDTSGLRINKSFARNACSHFLKLHLYEMPTTIFYSYDLFKITANYKNKWLHDTKCS